MTDDIPKAVYKGRGKCPSCGKKGLGIANHAHATGHKDFSRFSCRYCKKVFRRKERSPASTPQSEPDSAASGGCPAQS